MTTITILNGPNLNLLGTREPGIYGDLTLKDLEALCVEAGKKLGVTVDFNQSNHEGELIDWIQAAKSSKGIIINAGGYTHSSVAIHDALRSVGVPVIEVHLSNVYAREEFRHTSLISPVAKGVICGLGAKGYVLAMEALVS
jgi:3-dehydroquinate dehydratase-2